MYAISYVIYQAVSSRTMPSLDRATTLETAQSERVDNMQAFAMAALNALLATLKSATH